MKYAPHPACAVIPLPPQEEINELAESIKANGLREPITLTPDGLLLDGRCREMGCEIAGVEIRTEIYAGDPFLFVLDKNIRRRHLSKIQRELAVVQLANLQNGSNQFHRKKREGLSNRESLSVKEAAQKHGLSEGGIRRAHAILDKGAPNVKQMVANGEVSSYFAERAVQHASLETQAAWTAADVKREGQKSIDQQPGKQRKRGEQPRPKKTNWEYRPPLYLEKGYQMPTDIGTARRPGQPVQLWPVHIQNLMDDQILVNTAAGNVGAFVGRFQCKVDEFIAATNRLLAYKPVPEKSNGEQIDFAAAARKSLVLAGSNLEPALEWLTKLRAFLDEYLPPSKHPSIIIR